MAMPLTHEYFTADMVRALPDDGKRHELVDGELLVTPAPQLVHQAIVLELATRLKQFCERQSAGKTMISPADISWGPDSLVQPDVFVVAPEEAGASAWADIKTLRLVAEVLSPSTARQDRFAKRKLYQQHGVATLWLVDAERRIVEVWTPESVFPVVERERVAWHPAPASEPLRIDLAELFGL
ncbi:MAG TPA: Uma2 family endonuclease [Gemmatimonadaceae bacterium]|nr:Uma2 family endonuclease [Gemmatimonadaceae bacterium]